MSTSNQQQASRSERRINRMKYKRRRRRTPLVAQSFIVLATASWPLPTTPATSLSDSELPYPTKTHTSSSIQQQDDYDQSLRIYPERRILYSNAESYLDEEEEQNDDDIISLSKKFESMYSTLTSSETKLKRRMAQVSHVPYNNSHPFEIMKNERRERKRKLQILESEDEIEDGIPTSEEEEAAAHRLLSSTHQPLRLTIDTSLLSTLSPAYSAHTTFLRTQILPSVQSFWQNALRVSRLPTPLKIDPSLCPYTSTSQVNTGFVNTDLAIIINANDEKVCNVGSLAAASSCQTDQYDRPTIGLAYVCFDTIDLSNPKDIEKTKQVLIHEVAHILGVRADDMPFYRYKNGVPRTPRPFQLSNVVCVDGVEAKTLKPADNTLMEGFTNRGKRYYELVTPTVRTVVRNQFGCGDMRGARLENQPTNDGKCFGSHWEARLYTSETLAAIATPTPQYLSPLTLAALEDSGWYIANYASSSLSPFGHGAGCPFVYNDCIVNGQVPDWGKDYFCNEVLDTESEMKCGPMHRYISRCDLVDFREFPMSVPPSAGYQYFPQDPMLGGLLHTADYCPMYSLIATGTKATGEEYEFDCEDPSLNTNIPGETFGPTSKCFNTNLNRPLCMKYRCNAELHKVQVILSGDGGGSGGGKVVTCPYDGAMMDLVGLSSGAKFECPKLATICPDLICPGNCSGRGYCDYTKPNPRCNCCNPNDNTPMCINSPPGCEASNGFTYGGNGGGVGGGVGGGGGWTGGGGGGGGSVIYNPNRPTYTPPVPRPVPTPPAPNPVPTPPTPPSIPTQPSAQSVPSAPTYPTAPVPTPTTSGTGSNGDPSPTAIKPNLLLSTSSPTETPRENTSVLYTFCVEHGTLTPISKILRDTNNDITKTLDGLFQDDVQTVGNNWNVDESTLRVYDVSTVWLPDAPENLECDCQGGDAISACSAIESTVLVSHHYFIPSDKVRYILLLYTPYVTEGLAYTANYWGFVATEANTELTLYGVPPGQMLDGSASTFESVLKAYLNGDLPGLNIDGLKVLNIEVDDANVNNPITTYVKDDNYDGGYSRRRRIQDSSSINVVDINIVGEYVPPPDMDFEMVVSDSIDRGSAVIADALRNSGDPYFQNVKSVRASPTVSPTSSPTEISPETKAEGPGGGGGNDDDSGGSNVGLILGLLAVFFVALCSICAILAIRRKREGKEMESNMVHRVTETDEDWYEGEKPVDKDDPEDDMTYFSSYTDQSPSIITDPTYRGGAMPGADTATFAPGLGALAEEDEEDEESYISERDRSMNGGSIMSQGTRQTHQSRGIEQYDPIDEEYDDQHMQEEQGAGGGLNAGHMMAAGGVGLGVGALAGAGLAMSHISEGDEGEHPDHMTKSTRGMRSMQSNSLRSMNSHSAYSQSMQSQGMQSEVLETSVAMGRARAMADEDANEQAGQDDDEWHQVPPGENDDVRDLDPNDDNTLEEGTHAGEVVRSNYMRDDDVSALHVGKGVEDIWDGESAEDSGFNENDGHTPQSTPWQSSGLGTNLHTLPEDAALAENDLPPRERGMGSYNRGSRLHTVEETDEMSRDDSRDMSREGSRLYEDEMESGVEEGYDDNSYEEGTHAGEVVRSNKMCDDDVSALHVGKGVEDIWDNDTATHGGEPQGLSENSGPDSRMDEISKTYSRGSNLNSLPEESEGVEEDFPAANDDMDPYGRNSNLNSVQKLDENSQLKGTVNRSMSQEGSQYTENPWHQEEPGGDLGPEESEEGSSPGVEEDGLWDEAGSGLWDGADESTWDGQETAQSLDKCEQLKDIKPQSQVACINSSEIADQEPSDALQLAAQSSNEISAREKDGSITASNGASMGLVKSSNEICTNGNNGSITELNQGNMDLVGSNQQGTDLARSSNELSTGVNNEGVSPITPLSLGQMDRNLTRRTKASDGTVAHTVTTDLNGLPCTVMSLD